MNAENKKELTNNVIIAAIVFAALYLWKYLEPRLIKAGENAKSRWCSWRASKAEKAGAKGC